MIRSAALPLLIAALLTSGCDRRRDAGAVVVSVIGGPLDRTDPARGALDEGTRLLLDGTAQGLVRFDAAGQIEPGLAERWIVIDDGMSYIFRLRDATWPDGDPVTAAEVVAALRRMLAPASRDPLKPFLSAIDEVVEMTPEVIEVRLARPRPDLLKLFAQPEMGITRARGSQGSGPMRVVESPLAGILLRPDPGPALPDDDSPHKAVPESDVRLRGERASKAIARFAAKDSDLVTGGTFAEWPLVATAEIAPNNVHIDPAAGLFGLAIVNRDGFLADAANRAALAEAIDRTAISAALGGGWTLTEALLPEQLDSAAPPAAAGWSTLTLADRRAAARAQVAKWRQPVTLRIALPPGPGANLLYGQVGAALLSIGITPPRVGMDAPADLRLVDRVAPFDSARWYLANACAPCGQDAQAKLDAARLAPTLALRALHIAEADAALTADAAYIPIARPLRWSLVALRLTAWQGNSRAWHPLNRLRNENR